MAIHVALHHRSHYVYDRPVSHSPHLIRLRPAPHCRTAILSYSQKILPAKHFVNWQQDPFSNYLARVVFPEKTTELLVEIDLVAEMAVYNPFDFFLEPGAQAWPFVYDPLVSKELAPFLECGENGPLFDKFVASIDRTPMPTMDFLVALNMRLWKEVKYVIRLEPGVQSPEETLTKASGSCRDSAWLLAQVFRRIGIASRFASGYLIQLKPDVEALDGPVGADFDFTDLHAWTEVYLPGAGWIGLDPTSGLLAGEGHLPLACTPDPQGAAPVTGLVDECETRFSHEMRVTRIAESPRVTKPYTDEQWAGIEALGHSIDDDLARLDVRLTMGGEPTFVSIDDRDGEEWNFTAMGPHKRKLSGELLQRLRDRFAPGGFLHYGQGKWYPGESLPRWALACYWRVDGVPMWKDPSLLADEKVQYSHTPKDSQCFIAHLAHRLGLRATHILPAYEDVWYYLWRERRLPSNVDPLEAKLDDAEERARLTKVFEQGLQKVVGHVLPLEKRAGDEGGWRSGPWFLRREHLFLIPGDSPMGLRLPLDSLPWVSASDYPYVNAPDPMEKRSPLPKAVPAESQLVQSVVSKSPSQVSSAASLLSANTFQPRTQKSDEEASVVPRLNQSASAVVRTALCIEPREGRLHIFMPPLATVEDYLELLAAIEETATELKLPVVIEGSPPPEDPRLKHLKVTPDPGVIEVNLQPASNWTELVENTNILYEEARQTRLGTEKFMIDGRHVGTGGGNHVVLGGATPSDSPILRRPDLLRSLLCFWQNHPSLSFLFSGLFIGPTSQHPRVDEARNDSLYELEIAFRQIPEHGPVAPWLVDRVFRNLLTDATGNTHRAEFSIDKLYSPEGPGGRLGLVELRAFEMPPHARMSLTQQLLLRTLIARFWAHPYQQPLVRWGTELHDRFMLPHFVEEDFRDVIEDLTDAGYPLKFEWFLPHVEFRFPEYGAVCQRGVRMEIRQALEPWHVLGEQGAAGGAVRHVDSSLERLQVKVQGRIDTRHFVACNGKTLPLHPTGTEGEYVAGVRFRAWRPPECLQPTIGVQAPLTFDIVDSWNQRSLGGCTYHVTHPGGRSYDTLPVNAYEAESRRLSRFVKMGHTAGRIRIAALERNRDFPFTLDLRQC